MKNTNLIIGKINAGKTTGILFNELKKSIDNNENLVILDTKDEYYKTFKNILDNNGYNILVLNLKDNSKSNSFNPLMLPYDYYKKGNKDMSISLINQLALEIFKSENPNADPFWMESCANYFTTLALILFKEGTEKQINIGSIQAMLSLGTKELNDTNVIKNYFSNLDVLDSIYITGSSIVYAPFDTYGSIMSVMKQKLNAYCMKEQLLNNLCNNEINLLNLKNKTAIFIVGKNDMGNILIDQINQISNIEFTFYLDNLDDSSKLLELNNMLDSKTKLFVAIRNTEQLEYKYDKYILSRFECIIDKFNIDNQIKIGNTTEYPIAKINNIDYFNIEEFVKNNIK